MSSFYKETLNSNILNYAVWPTGIIRDIHRECIQNADSLIARLKERNLPYAGVLQFKPEDLSFEWSINLDIGLETVAMYRLGCSLPLIVVERKLPGYDENPEERAAFNIHHMARNGADNIFRTAVESTLIVLRDITVRWLKADLVTAEHHMHTWAVKSIDRKELQ